MTNIDDDEKLHEIAELKQKATIEKELSQIAHDSDHHKISELEQQSIIMKELSDEIIQKNEQLEKINHALERMSVIGELTSRLVHDLKNPLSVINLTTQMMKIETSNEKELSRIEQIDDSYNSIMTQIKDVLEYIKYGKLSFKKILLSDIISNAIKMTKITDKIKINQELKEITINADGLKLQVVFSNLLGNAVEAMNGEGQINIRVNEMGHNATIDFEDSGPGIPKEKIKKIFDPLFTTKSTGTGLGLVSCKKIVNQHKGAITVSSNPTTFTVTLPIET